MYWGTLPWEGVILCILFPLSLFWEEITEDNILPASRVLLSTLPLFSLHTCLEQNKWKRLLSGTQTQDNQNFHHITLFIRDATDIWKSVDSTPKSTVVPMVVWAFSQFQQWQKSRNCSLNSVGLLLRVKIYLYPATTLSYWTIRRVLLNSFTNYVLNFVSVELIPGRRRGGAEGFKAGLQSWVFKVICPPWAQQCSEVLFQPERRVLQHVCWFKHENKTTSMFSNFLLKSYVLSLFFFFLSNTNLLTPRDQEKHVLSESSKEGFIQGSLLASESSSLVAA